MKNIRRNLFVWNHIGAGLWTDSRKRVSHDITTNVSKSLWAVVFSEVGDEIYNKVKPTSWNELEG